MHFFPFRFHLQLNPKQLRPTKPLRPLLNLEAHGTSKMSARKVS